MSALPPPRRPKLRPLRGRVVERGGARFVMLRDPVGWSTGVAMVPTSLSALLAWMDGAHDVEALCARYLSELGRVVSRLTVTRLVSELDAVLMLESPRFDAEVRAIVRAYAEREARPMHFAEHVYPSRAEDCREALDGILSEARLPSMPSREGEALRALISPHIDFARGRATYAAAWGALAMHPPAEIYVLLGTGHAPMETPFALTRKGYETPYGVLEVDREAAEGLVKACGATLLDEALAHRREHSLEFQAVWLAHLLGARRVAEVTIVPVLCGSVRGALVEGTLPEARDARFGHFLDGLRGVLGGEREVCVVAGVDFAHLGPEHGQARGLDEAERAELEAEDQETLRRLVAGEAASFLEHGGAGLNARQICGLSPCYTMLRALEGRAIEGALLDYRQAVDEEGNVVSFAAARYVERG